MSFPDWSYTIPKKHFAELEIMSLPVKGAG